MSFIHVVLANIEANRLQHENAADTRYGFLLQPVAGIAAIKVVRYLPVLVSILTEVSVQQNNRYSTFRAAEQLIQPGDNPDRAPLDSDGYLGI